MRSVPVALTVAGSDSGAGAGIQADLKTFQALGVYGVCALTAVTAQDTHRVVRSEPLAASLVSDQIDVVLSDIGADSAKTGMLATADIVRAVADALGRHDVPNVVVDPILLSTAGDVLLDAAGMEALIDRLFPRATVVTPNVGEASVILGRQLETEDDLAWAAERLCALGPRAAIVTGGHLEGQPVDVLYDGEETVRIRGERIATSSTHGTGCTYSAAISAHLALGHPLVDAARAAKAYVTEALRSAPPLGRGRGPLAHGVTARQRAGAR